MTIKEGTELEILCKRLQCVIVCVMLEHYVCFLSAHSKAC